MMLPVSSNGKNDSCKIRAGSRVFRSRSPLHCTNEKRYKLSEISEVRHAYGLSFRALHNIGWTERGRDGWFGIWKSLSCCSFSTLQAYSSTACPSEAEGGFVSPPYFTWMSTHANPILIVYFIFMCPNSLSICFAALKMFYSQKIVFSIYYL